MSLRNHRPLELIWALLGRKATRRDQIVVIVLGARVTKAAYVKREGNQLCLMNYLLREAPDYKDGFSRELLTQHLHTLKGELGAEINQAVLVLSMAESVIRHVELPEAKVPDLRKMLKLNPKHYFQQDFPGYEFDCFALPAEEIKPAAAEGKPAEPAVKAPPRSFLVGGAKTQLLEDVEAAAKAAHLDVVQVTLSQVSLVNTAIASLPETVLTGAIALVDLGFRSTTISLLANGRLALSRVIALGSDQLTQGLADALGVTYPVAEGIKTVMPEKVQAKLSDLLAPLGQELRTAIHFFEAQQNQRITQVLVCGGAARSPLILQLLQTQLECPCQPLEWAGCLAPRLPEAKAADAAKDAPQLAVAVGAASACLRPELIQINFLAEKLEAQELQKQDPMRWVIRAGVLLVVLLGLWIGHLQLRVWLAEDDIPRYEAEIGRLERTASTAINNSRKLGNTEKALQALDTLADKRFLWALPLDALQFAMKSISNIQVLKLSLAESLVEEPATKARVENGKTIPAKLSSTKLVTIMSITAKDSGHPPALESFIQAITTQPYFHDHLRQVKPVELKDRGTPQVDSVDPTKEFAIFTIECHFLDREP